MMKRSRTHLLLFAMPSIAMLLSLFVVPLVWFFVKTLFIDGKTQNLVSYTAKVLTSAPVETSLLTTNVVALIVTIAVLLVSYPIAYYLTTANQFKISIVLFFVLVPYFVSIIVRTYSFMVLLGKDGLINKALLSSGLITHPLPLLYNKFSIVIGMVYILIPYMILTLYSSLKAIDMNLLKAGFALGGSRFYVFRRIYLPLSTHAILSGCLIVFIISIGFFITPSLLGGRSDVLIAMLIERAVEITLDWRQAAIISLFLLVVTLVLYGIYCRVTNIKKLLGTT